MGVSEFLPEDWKTATLLGRIDFGEGPTPVLVRGGGKADLRQVFANSHALMQQGAHGMVYGRNIYQHASPSRVVRALMAMIHDGANDEAAWRIYEERG